MNHDLAASFIYNVLHFLSQLSCRAIANALTMDLETRALEQFDKLVERGEISYRENEVIIVQAEPFNARTVSHTFSSTQ